MGGLLRRGDKRRYCWRWRRFRARCCRWWPCRPGVWPHRCAGWLHGRFLWRVLPWREESRDNAAARVPARYAAASHHRPGCDWDAMGPNSRDDRSDGRWCLRICMGCCISKSRRRRRIRSCEGRVVAKMDREVSLARLDPQSAAGNQMAIGWGQAAAASLATLGFTSSYSVLQSWEEKGLCGDMPLRESPRRYNGLSR